MTQLRHDRPVLNYLDNIRREARPSAPLPTASSPIATEAKRQPRRLRQSRDEAAFDRHLRGFEALPETSKAALGRLFEDASTLVSARLEYIEKLGNPKRKAAYDAAYGQMKEACAALNLQCRQELLDQKSLTREWLAKLRVVMGEVWRDFEEVDQLIAETRGG